MYTKLDGFNVKEVTLYHNGDIKPGMAVMISDNFTATIPTENARFIGICTSVRGNYASVALTGAVTASYSGTDFITGFNAIAPDGNGKLKMDFSGSIEYFVLDVNTDEKLITILL